MKSSTKKIRTIPFSEFFSWDFKRYTSSIFSYNYPTTKLKEVLSKPNIEWVSIEDDKTYPILGVRAQGKGVYINRIALGKELTMKKYQKSKSLHLFYCKVRTVGGQWGVVYPEFENSYGSSNMQYLEIDLTTILPEYIELLLKIKKLTDLWDLNAIGADGRHFTLSTLLDLEIPLPSLSGQKIIVNAYNNKIRLAEEQKGKAKELEKSIEDYLFEALGLKGLEESNIKKGLQFVNFKSLDRWDILARDLRIINGLSSSKYEVKTLGSAFNFVSRPWNKRKHNSDYFDYIELGAIDPLFGITDIKNIEIKKAPSRATQQVELGDLIIGTTRPYLKRFAIISEKFDSNICSSGFNIIEANTKYDLVFLKEFLMSFYGIEQLKNRMTGGSYPAITNSELKEIMIPFPPSLKQKEIGLKITNIKNEIEDLKNNAKENIKQALIDFELKIFSK